mmetsp:Transcript_91585/g.264142  ORF Transcript_91585/g.264142 Transcript_91585/m.264142 type:complete len:253 (-) Transcript_91585:2-760(-)
MAAKTTPTKGTPTEKSPGSATSSPERSSSMSGVAPFDGLAPLRWMTFAAWGAWCSMAFAASSAVRLKPLAMRSAAPSPVKVPCFAAFAASLATSAARLGTSLTASTMSLGREMPLPAPLCLRSFCASAFTFSVMSLATCCKSSPEAVAFPAFSPALMTASAADWMSPLASLRSLTALWMSPAFNSPAFLMVFVILPQGRSARAPSRTPRTATSDSAMAGRTAAGAMAARRGHAAGGCRAPEATRQAEAEAAA